MRRFQFSLRALLGSAVFVALACSSLLYASETIASIGFTVTALVLSAALLAALFRRGAGRAFWVGFAIFGWGYLWLAQGPEPILVVPAGGPPRLQQYQGLATTRLMCYTYQHLLPWVRTPPPGLLIPYGPSPSVGGYGQPMPEYGTPGPVAPGMDDPFGAAPAVAPAPTASSYPDLSSFIHVGHSLWAWLLALFGGLLARHFYVTREEEP